MAVADRTVIATAGASRWPIRLVVGSTLLCAALVLFRIGDKGLWFDEGFSVGIVDRSFGDVLWRVTRWEVNQSPYYLLLAGWWRVGQGEGFLRLLSAAPAVAAVPAVFVLGRRLFDPRVGAVAAALLAVHPLHVQWGQQLRAYSLATLLVVVCGILLLAALDRPDDLGPALLYGSVAALATYAHFYAGLVVLAQLVWAATVRPAPTRLLTTAVCAYGVLVAPLAWYVVGRDSDPLSWVGEQRGSPLVRTAIGLSGGRWFSVLVYAAAVGVGLLAIAATQRRPGGGGRRGAILPVLWLLLPIVVTTVSTVTVKPLLEPRFLIVVVPAMALVAGFGICRLPLRLGGALLALLLLLVSAVGLRHWYRTPTQEDWGGAAALVAAELDPGTALVVQPWGGIFSLRYYDEQLTGVPALQPRRGDPPVGTELVEVVRQPLAGAPPPFNPSYLAWRDRHYVLRDEQARRRVAVRTYDRVPVGEAEP